MIEFGIKGGKELEQSLAKLEEKIERKIGTQANRAGAAHLKKALAARLPRSNRNERRLVDNASKRLADSVAVRKQKGKRILHHVGVTGWARAYAHILEFGSKYQAPNPIWRQTLKQETSNILAVVGDKLREGIRKHG